MQQLLRWIYDQHSCIGRWDNVHSLPSWQIQQRVRSSMPRLQCRTISRKRCTNKLFDLQSWVCNGHSWVDGRCELHGLLIGEVQQRIDGGVCDMLSWVCDGHVGVSGCCELYVMCGGAVQQRFHRVVYDV